MKRLLFIVAILALTFSVSPGWCEIPKLINYQGMLTDELGDPLTGSYNLEFFIYDDTTAGDLEWSEIQNGVQVENGLFNVVLGRQTALDFPFDEPYWLAVKVGTETMPRVRISSVAYAYRASIADSALVAGSGGGWADDGSVVRLESGGDSVGIGTDAPGTKLHVVGGGFQLNTNEVGGYYCRMNGSEISGGMAGGAPGNHHLHIKPGDNSSYLLLAEDGGNVGIGTIEPTQTLDVNGTLRAESLMGVDIEPVTVDPEGVLHRGSPSSKRYKENIRSLDIDLGEILRLQAVRFEWKKTGTEDIGLIAEEVHQVTPDLVRYGDDGAPDGVRYDKLAVYLLEVLKAQQERISDLERRIATLER